MLIYGRQREYTLENFIVKRLMSYKSYWKHRLFPDHLNIKDYLNLAKFIYRREPIIYMSLESGEFNGHRYFRPGFCDFRISHKYHDSFYYNLLVNEYITGFFKQVSPTENKNERIVFISSNFNKIDKLFKTKTPNNYLIDYYGLYGRKVPIYKENDNDDKRPIWKKESQQLYANYSACICIENSYQEGYLQGSYIPTLMSGCVPIIDAEPYSLKNVLKKDSYIKYSDYLELPTNKLLELIKIKEEYIKGKQMSDFFTNLFNDYIAFLHEVDLEDIRSAIVKSQKYREMIIKE